MSLNVIQWFSRYLKDSLRKNALFLIANSIGTSGLGLLFWLIVGRSYNSEDVGIASTLIASASLLAALSTLGFNISLIRFLPERGKKESNEMINSCFTISVGISLIVSIIFLIGLDIWSKKLVFLKSDIILSILYIIFISIWVMSNLLNSIFIAVRRSRYVFIKNTLIFSVLKLPLPLILTFGAFGIFASWGIAALVALLISGFFLSNIYVNWKPSISVKRSIIKPMVGYSLWNYIGNLCYLAPSLLLPIMITNMLTPRVTAYFYISWMIANLLLMVPVSISNSLLAETATNYNELKLHVEKASLFTFIVLLPGILFIYLFGNGLLGLIGGEYARNAFHALLLFAVSSIPFAINSLYIGIAQAKKEVKSIVLIYGTIAIGTLSSSWYLIQTKGLDGVAFGWSLTNLIVCLFTGMKIVKALFKRG